MVVSQGFLAAAVAKALAKFCELDETLVQSRLLNKSRITLKDVRLRPRTIRQTNNFNVELHGKIKSGVFKWKWSGKGLLKRCTLSLSGVRITLKPVSGSTRYMTPSKKKPDVPSFDNASTEDGSESKKGKKRWKEKLVENIIEQIIVKIEDIQVVLEAPRNSKEEDLPWKRQVIIYGKNLELEPLGRVQHNKFLKGRALRKNKLKTPLLQDLRIGSLSAKVVVIRQDGTAEMLPLIHPFQYSVKAKRINGKRFNSLSTGLEVTGQKITSLPISHSILSQSGSLGAYESIRTGSDRVEIYADEQEVEASLCDFPSLNNSVSVSWDYSQSSEGFQETRDDEMEVRSIQEEPEPADELYIVLGNEQLTSLFSVLKLFTEKKDTNDNLDDPKPLSRGAYLRKQYMRPGGLGLVTKVAPMHFAKSSRSIMKTSHFDLPFPMVQIDLPNNTSLYAEECNVKFRADESLGKIYGTGEVTINHETLLGDGVTWTVDMKRKEIKIEPPKELPTSQWEWNFNSIEEDDGTELKANFDRIRKVSTGIAQVIRKKKEVDSDKPPSPKSSRGLRWSVKLLGNSSLQF